MPDVTNQYGQTFIFVTPDELREISFALLGRYTRNVWTFNELLNVNQLRTVPIGIDQLRPHIFAGEFFGIPGAHLVEVPAGTTCSPMMDAHPFMINISRNYEFTPAIANPTGIYTGWVRNPALPPRGGPLNMGPATGRLLHQQRRYGSWFYGPANPEQVVNRARREAALVRLQEYRRRTGGTIPPTWRAPRSGVATVRILGVLVVIVVLYYAVDDFFSNLGFEDEDDMGFCNPFDCDGPFVLTTRERLREFRDDLLNPRIFPRVVDDDGCRTAAQIVFNEVYRARLADDGDERWFVILPSAIDLPGDGPWTCSLQVGTPMTLLGETVGVPITLNAARPLVEVMTGYCGSGTTSFDNFDTPLVSERAPGCYEFSLAARHNLYVQVTGQFARADFSVRTTGCVTDPGVSCAEATAITADGTYGPFTLASGSHWFKVTHASGNYRLLFNVSAMDGQSSVGTFWGPDCDNLTPDLADNLLAGNFCTWDTLLENTDLWIQVTIGTSTELTYTLQYLAGGDC